MKPISPVLRKERKEDFEEARPWVRTALAVFLYSNAASARRRSPLELDRNRVELDVDAAYSLADNFVSRLEKDLSE